MKKMYKTADQSNKYKQLKAAVKSLEREGFTFINAMVTKPIIRGFLKLYMFPVGIVR